MQKLRLLYGWSVGAVAESYGCAASHVSRVEHGKMPAVKLIEFYEQTFEADGLLRSLLAAASAAPVQERARIGGRRPRPYKGAMGDESTFLGDTVPHGTMMRPGVFFVQTWHVQNSGTVAWVDRRLERQGPITGPGLITSPQHIPILDTPPGGDVRIGTPLKAPTYDCASIAYFKMIDRDGRLCFPDHYALGLDVLVLVRGQAPDISSEIELDPEHVAPFAARLGQ
jgi:transcriptional regulator with XRE-family HTH domain